MASAEASESTKSPDGCPDQEASPGPYRLLSANLKDEYDLERLPEKEQVTRLQALFSDWLRTQNFVVLLGAGASIPEGGKTVANLEKTVLSEAQNTSLQEKEKSVLKRRQADTSNTIDFETWLSVITNLDYLQKNYEKLCEQAGLKNINGDQTPDYRAIMGALGRWIFHECSLTLKSRSKAHQTLFAKLLSRDPNLGRLHVFTPNYDTLIEQALEELRVQYADGFVGRISARFDPSVYDLDLYHPGDVTEGRVRRYDKYLHLYKLHGSVNWRVDPHTGEIEQTPTTASQVDGNTLGILPTANKQVQTIDQPFSFLFRALHRRLSEPQTFFLVVGYSFSDSHVNRIIDLALTNPSLTMLVVETAPDGGVLEQKIEDYESLGDRVMVLNPKKGYGPGRYADLKDLALNLLPRTEWLEQFRRIRTYEKTIGQHEKNEGNGEPTV